MVEDDALPRIYLITPPVLDLDIFPDQLARVIDGQDIACLRLTLALEDEGEIARAADRIREVAHPRDVPVVLTRHVALAERLGMDGVHLEGPRGVRAARETLGEDAIVGAFCKGSRHEGLSAGEAGADYVAFGPIGDSGLGDGSQAELELLQWWSDVIEVPVVAEGALTVDAVAALATLTDFLGIGSEIWSRDDPNSALSALLSRITG